MKMVPGCPARSLLLPTGGSVDPGTDRVRRSGGPDATQWRAVAGQPQAPAGRTAPYADVMPANGTPDRHAPWWSARPAGRPRPKAASPRSTPRDLVDLRRTVLRDGRADLPASYPFDAEPSSLHLGVVNSEGTAVGGVTVVVDPLPGFATLQLALMAVDPAIRRQGVGRLLVLAVQERAAEAGLAVWAAARVSALDFYTGLGFRARGDVYIGPMDLPHRHILWRTTVDARSCPGAGARSGPSRPAACAARSAG